MSKVEERANKYVFNLGGPFPNTERCAFSAGYRQALKDIEEEIEHRTLNAHDMPDGAKDKEFYCGMDAAFSDILVYIDSLEES